MNGMKLYHKTPIWMQNIILSIYGFRVKKERYGRYFNKYLDYLNSLNLDTPQKLKDYQESKLKEMIIHAYETVPYYKRLFDEIDLNPYNFSMADYNKIPILEKEVVISNIEDFTSKKFKKKSLRITKTGGTTGTAMHFYRDKYAFAREYAFVYYKSREGFKYNEKRATFNGRFIVPLNQTKPPFWRRNYAINQTLYSSYHLSNHNLFYYVKELNRQRPIIIEGYPSNLYIVATYILENKLKINFIPKAIFTSSETILDYQREIIEKVFSQKVSDLYGQAEKSAMIYQCEEGNYHIVKEYGYTEIIKNKFDENEIVSTGFINYATPLIRYRINDHIKLSKLDLCSCGNNGLIIDSIDGRIEDIIELKSGRRIGRLNDQIFKNITSVKYSQITYQKFNNLVINVVPRLEYSISEEKKIINRTKEIIGNETSITVNVVKSIQKSKNGKFRSVITRKLNS